MGRESATSPRKDSSDLLDTHRPSDHLLGAGSSLLPDSTNQLRKRLWPRLVQALSKQNQEDRADRPHSLQDTPLLRHTGQYQQQWQLLQRSNVLLGMAGRVQHRLLHCERSTCQEDMVRTDKVWLLLSALCKFQLGRGWRRQHQVGNSGLHHIHQSSLKLYSDIQPGKEGMPSDLGEAGMFQRRKEYEFWHLPGQQGKPNLLDKGQQ